MVRRPKTAQVASLPVNWWSNTYVLMRKRTDEPYGPGNVCWRRAENEHEAMLGIEEVDPAEPVALPMSRERARERAKRKDSMSQRFFDLHTRMLYRAGGLRMPSEQRCVLVETTPFPSGWKPGDEEVPTEN